MPHSPSPSAISPSPRNRLPSDPHILPSLPIPSILSLQHFGLEPLHPISKRLVTPTRKPLDFLKRLFLPFGNFVFVTIFFDRIIFLTMSRFWFLRYFRFWLWKTCVSPRLSLRLNFFPIWCSRCSPFWKKPPLVMFIC